MALVHCHSCGKVLHEVSPNGKLRWLGNCPHCKSPNPYPLTGFGKVVFVAILLIGGALIWFR